MPIEIRELTIKVNVNQDQNNAAADTPGAGTAGNAEDKEAIVKEAVEEMLRILENKKER